MGKNLLDESNLHCKIYGQRIYFNENNFFNLLLQNKCFAFEITSLG